MLCTLFSERADILSPANSREQFAIRFNLQSTHLICFVMFRQEKECDESVVAVVFERESTLLARSTSGHVAENICIFTVMNTKRTYVDIRIKFFCRFIQWRRRKSRKTKEERQILKSLYTLSLPLSFCLFFPTSYWWLLLSKCELNWYRLQHCSPQILHFHGLLSLWQPLWRKYNVWSGNVMRQWVHWRPLVRGSGLVEVGGSPLECGFEFTMPPPPPPLLLLLLLLVELVDSLRRRSSRSNDFNGDTLISEGNGRLLDVAPLSSIPLLFGSCLMGIREIDGVMASSLPPTFLRKTPMWFVNCSLTLMFPDCRWSFHEWISWFKIYFKD